VAFQIPTFTDETTVVPMLTKMKLPRHVLLELANKIGGERANVAEHEPSNVVGFETWRWGTRLAREDKTLSGLGWVCAVAIKWPGFVILSLEPSWSAVVPMQIPATRLSHPVIFRSVG